jgi:hypothetical protein
MLFLVSGFLTGDGACLTGKLLIAAGLVSG